MSFTFSIGTNPARQTTSTVPSFAEPSFQRYQNLDDGMIIPGEHVISDFESEIRVVKTEHGDASVYAVTSNDQNAKTYRIIDVAVDMNKCMTVIEVYLRPPTCCKVPIAEGFGNMREGVTLTIGYPPFGAH
ncbi:hypothetical protein EDD15DRAFT_2368263 [Pisolithus albus]|nr:hypothetical protein EDD15DRAFT_2368263 [Pisolithus albus]